MADEKRQRRPRPAVPQLALHPVQVERQRRGDGRARAQLAAEIGVDRLCWELTDHPEDALLAALRARLAGARRHPARDLGRQQPGQRDSRRHAARAHRGRGRSCPGVPLIARAGRPLHGPHARPQPVDARRFPRRRPTAAGWCASARSCATRDGTLIDRDFARAWLPADARAGRPRRRRRSTIPAPAAAGTLRAEVRSGQRRDRLVRALRIADDDEDAAW